MKNTVLDGLDIGQAFKGGIVKTAVINLSNNSVSDKTYDVELYLSSIESGSIKDATSDRGSITIPAGGTITVQFTLTLPEDEGEYFLFLDISVDDKQPITYKAQSKITILPSQEVVANFIQWQ